MTALVWEYWGDFNSSKELMDFYTGTPKTYSQPILLDYKKPKKTVSLIAKGVASDSMLALQATMDSIGPPSQFVMSDGSEVSGVMTSFAAKPIIHTNLYDITIQVRVDGMQGTVVWEYWGDFASSREVLEFYNPVPGQWVPPTFVDYKIAKTVVGLQATGVSLGDTLALYAQCNAQDAVVTLTTADGQSVTGIPISFNGSPIIHTGLYNIKLQLRTDGTFDTNIIWQYYGSINTERTLEEFYPAPIGGAYQTPVFYDQKLPKKTVGITAKTLPKAAADTIQVKMDQGPMEVQVFSMADGTTISGIMTSCSIEQIEFTSYYNVHIQVRTQ